MPLSTPERSMLYWSEELPPADQDTALNAEFEDNYDRVEYEAKISKLIRAAYKQDRRDFPAEIPNWWAAIHSLERGDNYILVMLRQASLRPPGDLWHLSGAALAILAVLVGFIFLSARLSFPDWIAQAFPWLLIGSIAAVWTASSPERRRIARSIGEGMGQALVVIPRAAITVMVFSVRVALRKITMRSR